ncbi:MAG: acetolactate decarboxylase [Cyanobacteria bacterium]|nr:acetolactate decarboxylase [Cyanobacteriota bacterium]
MKEIYDDNAEGKIKLSELKGTEHLYALGPLSKLRGEILIWDSLPFESRANNGHIQVKSDWEESAAFLAWSSVRKWKKVEVPSSVRSQQTLQMWLNHMSGKPGAPLPKEYPFLLKGHFGRILWHVVNVKQDGKPLTPQKHQDQKFHGQTQDVKAEMLGFYAPEKEGIVVPRGQVIHMHVKVSDNLVAHVEDFDPVGDYGIKLYVPSE